MQLNGLAIPLGSHSKAHALTLVMVQKLIYFSLPLSNTASCIFSYHLIPTWQLYSVKENLKFPNMMVPQIFMLSKFGWPPSTFFHSFCLVLVSFLFHFPQRLFQTSKLISSPSSKQLLISFSEDDLAFTSVEKLRSSGRSHSISL